MTCDSVFLVSGSAPDKDEANETFEGVMSLDGVIGGRCFRQVLRWEHTPAGIVPVYDNVWVWQVAFKDVGQALCDGASRVRFTSVDQASFGVRS